MQPNQSTFGRRNFIRITAVAASALGGATVWTLLRRRSEQPAKLRETRLLMGSLASLTVVTDDPAAGREAVADSFDSMQRLESVLSRFRPDSQLSLLNRDGAIQAADPALSAVVGRALEYGEITGGAFDISVEPVLATYRQAAQQGLPMESVAVEPLLAAVDYRQVLVDGNQLWFGGQGMAITLDGIAKGFIIDEGARALTAHGFDRILVEVGGDMMSGPGPDGNWQIAIRSPRPDAGEWIATAGLDGAAMATSGDYFSSFTQDYSLHHILDPRTGLSPAELASVSVVAPSAMDADALSTSLMVLGTTAGLQLVDRLPGVEALLVGKNQLVHRSDGFPIASN